MNEKEFDELINELRELSFEVNAGEYYYDKCLEFDDVLEALKKRVKKKHEF